MCIFKKTKVVQQASAAVDSQIAQQQATIDALIKQGEADRTQARKDQEDLITSLTAAAQAQLAEAQKANTSLTQQIKDAQDQAAKSQEGLLAGFQSAMATQAADAGKLLNALGGTGGGSDTSSWYGQNAKKPNYKKALDKNKALESGGLSSTNLTGPSGVASTSLTLGVPALLGA